MQTYFLMTIFNTLVDEEIGEFSVERIFVEKKEKELKFGKIYSVSPVCSST